MTISDDPTTNDTTTLLDAHLESIRDALHTLQQARNHHTLQPDTMASVLHQLQSHFTRDFPPERAAAITELSVQDLIDGYWNRVAVRKTAAPTGMVDLDSALGGGFQAKRLVTLLGAPGGGKTSLANQIAERIAEKRPVLYVTSEDIPDVLIAKSLSRIGDVDYSVVLYGWETWRDDINRAIKMLSERPSARNLRYLDVTAGVMSLNEMRDRAATHFEGKPGPGLIVVDYLQRMARSLRESAGTKELREAVTQLTERLRAIACELNCTVLAIASMNRASGYGKNSEVSALSSAKESGDIEYGTDILMALTEDPKAEASTGEVAIRRLKVDKNRQGRTTTVSLAWRANRQEFRTLEVEVV